MTPHHRSFQDSRFFHSAAVLAIQAVMALIVTTSPGMAQPGPIVSLPEYESTSVDGFFHLDLTTGQVFLTDQLSRSEIRAQRLSQNLFTEIGRPTDQPAREGEIFLGPIRDGDGALRSVLFVESSTGYIAYFQEIGRGSTFGQIEVVIGRPFGPIAANDGNFALVMRRDRSGRTDGAYLYHATTGRGLYVGNLRKLDNEPPVAATTALPKLQGRVAAVAIQSSRGATTGFLIADSGSGELYFVDSTSDSTSQLAYRKSPLDLSAAFAADGEAETDHLFLGVPLQQGEATRHALFVDVNSGEMVVIQDLDTRPTLRKLRPKLYDVIDSREPGNRHLALVPALEGGDTKGVWVIDGPTRAVVYIENPATPGSTLLRRVGFAGR